MMEEYGFPKNKVIPEKQMIFLKKNGIITSNGDILLSVTWYPEM